MTAAKTDTEGAVTAGEVLKQHGATRYFGAVLFDDLADAFWLVALGWVAAQAHTSFEAGLVLMTSGLPQLVMLPVGGWLTDRIGQANAATITLGLRTVLLAGWTAVIAHDVSAVAAIGVANIVVGLISGLHVPAIASYPTALISSDGISTATQIGRQISRVSQTGGALLGGYVIASLGLVWLGVFAALGVAVAWVLVVSLGMGLRRAKPPETEKIDVQGARAGWRFAWRHRVLRFTLAVQAFASALAAAAMLVVLPFKARTLDLSATTYGAAFGLYAVGMITGTAAIRLHRQPVRRQLIAASGLAAATGAVGIGLAFAWNMASLLIGALLLGLTLGPVGPALTGYLMTTAKAEERTTGARVAGRAASLLLIVTDAMEPFVLFLAATAAGLPGGVTVPAVVLAGLCLLVGALALRKVQAADEL